MSAICPVCGEEVETDDPMESDYRDDEWTPVTIEHDGETHRLCSEDCADQFEGSPDEYL